MRYLPYALLLASFALAPAAFAQTAPAPAAPAPATPAPAATAAVAGYSVEDTDVGTLLDNPATKAILVKYLPDLIASPQIDMARSLTLKSMQSYAPDKLSDDALAKIQVELSKVPVKK